MVKTDICTARLYIQRCLLMQRLIGPKIGGVVLLRQRKYWLSIFFWHSQVEGGGIVLSFAKVSMRNPYKLDSTRTFKYFRLRIQKYLTSDLCVQADSYLLTNLIL